MTTATTTFDTKHEDMILIKLTVIQHDSKFDYYGKRLATCSSDRTIKIFDVTQDNKPLAELKGHEGPVWQVAWAHPQFGSILASCSYDHKVFIWREGQNNQWSKIYEYKHLSSVNAVAWAPHELGLVLASASSDSTIVVNTYREQTNTWDPKVIKDAHDINCNAISWAPSAPLASLTNQPDQQAQQTLQTRLVSGGGDHLVKVWVLEGNEWKCEFKLDKHSDWVRDVAWASNIGLPYDTIASCSQDQNVYVWRRDTNSTGNWNATKVNKFNTVVWRVSWSLMGNLLAVSTADNQVTLWKEGLDGNWTNVSTLTDQNSTTAPSQ
ncbi:protein transport protein SEC13 [Acrasis kona]|uniref:Protein transport protein SEC13 n=1 Tax=Acrasis kona TaxID=1008807 RepID=A0AAW2ZF30_9EUKA